MTRVDARDHARALSRARTARSAQRSANARAATDDARLVIALKPDGDLGLLEPVLAAYRDEPEALPHARTDLQLEGLAIEPLPRWSGIDPLLAAHYAGRDGRRGGALPAPRFGEPVDDLPALLRLVELGRCIAFLPGSVADRYARDGVVQRDVEGLEPTRLHVAWPSNGRSPATAAFIRAATDVAAQRATTAAAALST